MPAAFGPQYSRWIFAACLTVSVALATPLEAQYPVAPTPVFSAGSLTAEPRFSGYLSVRETIRDDTMTFIIHRARLGVTALPAPFIALKLQTDFAAIGRTSGDTIPGILVTDAYIQLAPNDTANRMVQLLHPALVVGQFKVPFSLEYLTSSSSILTANRAFPGDRLSPKRDRGFMGQVRVARVVLSAALVDGEGTNRTSNPDGREMAAGRLTVLPLPQLSVSGKWAGQGSDHRWGYDARWVPGAAVLEGEVVEREGPGNATTDIDARGAYVLAAYRIRWIQPVVKWEQLHETVTSATATTRTRATLVTVGANLFAPGDRVRAQFNWVGHSVRPVDRKGELIAQLQAMF